MHVFWTPLDVQLKCYFSIIYYYNINIIINILNEHFKKYIFKSSIYSHF